MVKLYFSPLFKKLFLKIKDKSLKERIIKQFPKIKQNPEIGKPMMFARKGTRELYVNPYRISHIYFKGKGEVVLLKFYHKDQQ